MVYRIKIKRQIKDNKYKNNVSQIKDKKRR